MEPDDLIGGENPYAVPKVTASETHERPLPTEGIDLETENPFLTIWTRPRATIRGIVNTDPTLHVTTLAAVGGILQALNRAATRNAGDHTSIEAIMIGALIGGAIGGLVSLYIGGWLLRIAGHSLGGQAEPEEVRAALAWFTVPALVTIPIWVVQLALFGREMFTSATPTLDANPSLGFALIATSILEMIFGVWSVVIAIKCLAEVQRFSAWKALGSIVLVALVILVPLVVIALLALAARG